MIAKQTLDYFGIKIDLVVNDENGIDIWATIDGVRQPIAFLDTYYLNPDNYTGAARDGLLRMAIYDQTDDENSSDEPVADIWFTDGGPVVIPGDGGRTFVGSDPIYGGSEWIARKEL